jgi:transcriptional regulator with XRE-family HTH domain
MGGNNFAVSKKTDKTVLMDTKIIGSKIAKARKEINMSQAQLAQSLFISPQAVGKWERGESVPDIITINRLAEILGVDLNYFSENFQSTDAKPAFQNRVDTTGDVEPADQRATTVPLAGSGATY